MITVINSTLYFFFYVLKSIYILCIGMNYTSSIMYIASN